MKLLQPAWEVQSLKLGSLDDGGHPELKDLFLILQDTSQVCLTYF